jgi:hypothetical protein
MMKSLAVVERAIELFDQGLSKRAIASRLGVSRAAVRTWVNEREWATGRKSRSSMDCAQSCEPWSDLTPRVYSYLLGMYLGDGCISETPGSSRLRIVCCDAYRR